VNWLRELLMEETKIDGELAEVEEEDHEAEAETDVVVVEIEDVQSGWINMVHLPGLITGSLWRICLLV